MVSDKVPDMLQNGSPNANKMLYSSTYRLDSNRDQLSLIASKSQDKVKDKDMAAKKNKHLTESHQNVVLTAFTVTEISW